MIARATKDRGDVEDEGDASIAEDGRAGDSPRAVEELPQPLMMASVSGTRMVTTEPRPGLLRTESVPLSARTLRRTTSIPTPRPESSVTDCDVENPGAKTKA